MRKGIVSIWPIKLITVWRYCPWRTETVRCSVGLSNMVRGDLLSLDLQWQSLVTSGVKIQDKKWNKNRTIRIKNQQAFSFYSLINSQKLSLKIRSQSSMVRNKETSALYTSTSGPWTKGACHLRRFPLSSSARFNGRKKTPPPTKKKRE